ncbi:hypothetical protein DSOL_1802 [Desulfosporosinus metallidurans]|uniref:Uncharacterized protein n=1 Tax=Desulfosporosinus metallidurans TaxID=1888891 RepID=A0A1Q8QXZ7_9FIRM|nr:hypothetical protein DSOL_1802 [Desulfosporosinus metallidurans]
MKKESQPHIIKHMFYTGNQLSSQSRRLMKKITIKGISEDGGEYREG